MDKKEIVRLAGLTKQKNIPFVLDRAELTALVRRVAGNVYADAIDFAQMPAADGMDCCRIQDADGKILIEASSGVAAACAFNHYLRERCRYTVGPLFTCGQLPQTPPSVGTPIVKESRFHYRYLFNYCTFGYTYAFYDWAKWEKTLDWVLLSGYNLVLNPIAQETVWVRVLMELGYSFADAKKFIAGPAFMPWFLMMNLSDYHGEYPDWWFKERMELSGRFNRRLQAFGAAPLMPGYGGMVPDDFGSRFPESSPVPQGLWCGYQRPGYILPGDPMFRKVGTLFYRFQQEIGGGKDVHYYSCDPFHEGGITDGIDLKAYARGVYELMSEIDPQAVWCFQGWQTNPKREIMAEVPKKDVLVMNLCGETTFDGGDNFGDNPWLYCAVNNFGGQHTLRGGIKNSLNNPFKGLQEDYTMVGIGLLPEAVETDEVFFDLIPTITFAEKAPETEDCLRDFIARRYGVLNEELLEAWMILAKNVYGKDVPDGGDESPFCSRPSLTVDCASSWGGHSTIKDPQILLSVIELLLKHYDECAASEAYRYDVVDFTRQLLANESWKAVYGLQEAFKAKDIDRFTRLSRRFLARFDLLEAMLKTHKSFLLGTRIQEARALGRTEFEKRWFEIELRTLITVWAHKPGDVLHDYAAREYSGMVSDFYKPRWEAFISQLEASLATGAAPVEYERYDQDALFAYGRREYPTEPQGDLLEAVLAVLENVKDNLSQD